MPYTAVLVKNGSWKLDRVTSQILFKEKMKNAYEQYLVISMLNQVKKHDMSAGEEIQNLSEEIGKKEEKPLADLYNPTDSILRGSWAAVTRISTDAYFKKIDRTTMEPGIQIKDGFFTPPGTEGPTEIVYNHDGSSLNISGIVTVLDCLDYCAQKGSVEFIITGDKRELWNSGLILQGDKAKSFNINIKDIHELRFITNDGNNGNGEDWAAWLNLEASTLVKESSNAPAIVKAATSLPESTGRIERIYTISSRPTGSNVISREVFDPEAKEVFVWFEYSDLLPGTILKGLWLDEGRQLKLKEFPILITQNNGAAGFSIRRPIEGWIRGKYRVDLIHGDKILGSTEFRIIE